MKLNVMKEKLLRKCYECEKKEHLKKNCKNKDKIEIYAINEIKWNDLNDDKTLNN